MYYKVCYFKTKTKLTSNKEREYRCTKYYKSYNSGKENEKSPLVKNINILTSLTDRPVDEVQETPISQIEVGRQSPLLPIFGQLVPQITYTLEMRKRNQVVFLQHYF